MAEPLRVAFLGCGFITRVHSRHLRALGGRDRGRLRQPRPGQGGGVLPAVSAASASYGDYLAAIDDPRVDAVVVAVPPRFHLDLTLQALAGRQARAGREAGVPAAWTTTRPCVAARDRGRARRAGRRERSLQAAGRAAAPAARRRRRSARWCSRTSSTIAQRLKTADDWRNDEAMAGGDAFFEEGIHWLHLAGSLGPTITSIHGYRPSAVARGPGPRVKSMMVAFRYDNGAVGSLYYSREIPSLFQRPAAVEAVRPRRRHHVRIERRCSSLVRGGGPAAADLPGLPRHPRLPGDVSRLRRRRSGRGARRR